MRKYIFYGVGAVALISLFLIWFIREQNKQSFVVVSGIDGNGANAGVFASQSLPPSILIDISGEIEKPGVYELPSSSRLYDAVELAGGLTENADRVRINLSRKLKDEEKIVVPAKGSGESGEAFQETDDGRVNINTAGKSALMTLDGIGDKIADAVIDYRETHGGFITIDEIKNVPRIGEKVFEGIRDKIKVE